MLRNKFAPLWILSIVLFALITIMIFYGKANNIELGSFSRDLNALSGNPFYFGAITFLCSFFWSFTVAICFFTSYLLKKSSAEANYFFIMGIFNLVLLLDDVFMIHEEVFPQYLGIPERVLYLLYAAFLGYSSIKYFSLIRKSNYGVLFPAIILLGSSAFMDILANNILMDKNFYEDVLKLFGTLLWFYYFFHTAHTVLSSKLKET